MQRLLTVDKLQPGMLVQLMPYYNAQCLHMIPYMQLISSYPGDEGYRISWLYVGDFYERPNDKFLQGWKKIENQPMLVVENTCVPTANFIKLLTNNQLFNCNVFQLRRKYAKFKVL